MWTSGPDSCIGRAPGGAWSGSRRTAAAARNVLRRPLMIVNHATPPAPAPQPRLEARKPCGGPCARDVSLRDQESA